MNIDSLLVRLKSTNDTAYVNVLVKLADQYMVLGKMNEAQKCLEEASEKNSNLRNKFSEVYITLKTALYHYKKSEFSLSYELCEEILLTAIETKEQNKIAECKTYMGMNQGRLGDFKKALEYYQEALPMFEATKNISMQMKVYSNIAGVYFDQLDYKMAIEYFKKTLEMAIKTKDNRVIGQTYNNIGSAIQNTGNKKEAKEYYLRAAEINLLSDNKANLGYNYMNLASCELDEGDVKKAKEYNEKALKIFKNFKDPYSIVSCMAVVADIYIKENNFAKAVEVLEEAVKLCEKTGSPLLKMRTYKQMADAYELAGNLKKSIYYFKQHLATKDSIVNDEIREGVTKKQLHYEFDKKHLADSLESQAKQKYLLQEVENNQRRASMQRNISIISLLSLLVVATLAVFIYRGFKRNKLANKLIEEKSKEIRDSFFYAKKIQTALLPSLEMIKRSLPECFVLFKPKDIVSGDFYWMHKVNDNTILIAVGDCTGHGVPGAMVSVVCSNALNRAAKEFGITEPGKILDKVRELVIENFAESKSEVKDGMDISLCKIDINSNNKNNVKIEWAGANNPLWYTLGNVMIEISANKQPIGNTDKIVPFCTQELELKKGEMIFLFTDGYADQFGGDKKRNDEFKFGKGKKFKYRRLQELLLTNNKQSVENQVTELDNVFEKWRGDLEQVDDVCIIGIRV